MIVAGFGFRAGASEVALRGALAAARAASPAAPGPEVLATAADRAGHPAIAALARSMGLPLRGVALAALPATGAAPSARAPARYGGVSLAEAAALAAAGPGARLLAPRAASPCRTATCALAEGGEP